MRDFQYAKVAIVLCLALAGGQRSVAPQIFTQGACRHKYGALSSYTYGKVCLQPYTATVAQGLHSIGWRTSDRNAP
jgi:hypothetical protein